MLVSVVIPCFNEERYIVACMESVCAQQLNPGVELEVLVCDGNSKDRTPELIRRFEAIHPQVKYLLNEKQTTPYALNLGITHSKSDVVIIFGAHAVMKPGYVQRCLDDLAADPTLGCVGGLLSNVYENEASRVIGLAMSSSFGVGNAHFRTGAAAGYVDTVAFGAYTRAVFNKAGLFDEELTRNQDDEFNYRLLINGFKIWLDPQIRADYYVRASVKKLYRQYFQYGYWKVYVNKKHRAITTIRQLIPFFFVCFLWAGAIGSLLSRYAGIAFAAILLLYLALALSFAFRKTKRPAEAIKITGIFAILHVSYGWGYLLGIIDFMIRRKGAGKFQSLSR